MSTSKLGVSFNCFCSSIMTPGGFPGLSVGILDNMLCHTFHFCQNVHDFFILIDMYHFCYLSRHCYLKYIGGNVEF